MTEIASSSSSSASSSTSSDFFCTDDVNFVAVDRLPTIYGDDAADACLIPADVQYYFVLFYVILFVFGKELWSTLQIAIGCFDVCVSSG